MVKPKVSRTINPLHFEDLEPHRFEDLIRQLAYGFRNWLRLEATGRLGADEGMDVRGLEMVVPRGDSQTEANGGTEDDEAVLPPPLRSVSGASSVKGIRRSTRN
jgi:hypothetical protein